MAWEGFGIVGALAATPRGMGWVFIATPHKLAIVVQKLAIMTCTGAAPPRRPVALLRKFVALPQLLETAQVTSQKMP